MDIYREKLLDHYNNPRNYGKLVDADAIIKLENISCGDSIELYLKVENGKAVAINFEGEGCAVAIASASMLTEFAVGKTIEEIKQIDFDELQKILGIQLTLSRIKCANLSLETLQKALKSIENNQI